MEAYNSDCTSLRALTTAALILPGLIQPVAHATAEDSVDFQYSHYQEGKRAIYGDSILSGIQKLPQNLNPIEVDRVHGSARITLTDRIKFAFNYTQDTWSGATPIGTAPAIAAGNRAQFARASNVITGASPIVGEPGQFYVGKNLNLYPQSADIDPTTGRTIPGAKNNQVTHVLSFASPETRKQGDFKLSYEWAGAALDVGGGISIENDYESRFVNLGGRMDFNQKQTSVNLGLGYTHSDTFATIDPAGLQFIGTGSYEQEDGSGLLRGIEGSPAQIDSTYPGGSNSGGFQGRTGAVLHGSREDWGAQLGLTQVLGKDALLDLGLGYTRSIGFLANPYKVVYIFSVVFPSPSMGNELVLASGRGFIETRPEERNQFNWNLGYSQYIVPLDAALHFDYRFAHDDWGVNAHTFEADWVQPLGAGWTATPRIRYYSQSSAEFYTPYFIQVSTQDPNTGEIIYSKPPPKYFSSDQRLSGFGSLSGGVTIAKQFTKGIQLETGFEYYTHQGGLKIGGGGEQDFADYDYWVANAALKVDLAALGTGGGHHDGHSGYGHHHQSNSPAGIMFDHTLAKTGDFMLGYRYMHSEQAGDMLLNDRVVSERQISQNACPGSVRINQITGTPSFDSSCSLSPREMTMNMHMLDLMYAPTDWLTLMLMPQWMDMEMDMTPLVEQVSDGSHLGHTRSPHSHQTGGIGDTGLYALFKLFDHSGQHVNLSLGGTAPTGDVDITLRKTAQIRAGTPIHYGMQLGSGTWDFKPSLTYTGEMDGFSWGAQVTGTKRLESHNKSGFAFGDLFQGSVWGGYQWTDWLSTTVRGIYSWQGSLRGEYPSKVFDGNNTPIPYPYGTHNGPFDKPVNYGGQFVDLGLGINVTIPIGAFAGNSLKFEWLQPLHTDYNGYQLDRDGALSATWSVMF